MELPDIRQWTVDCRREPLVRIGIVLAEDEMTWLSFLLPKASCRLHAEDGTVSTLQAGELRADLTAQGRVRITGQPQESFRWELAAHGDEPLAKNSGVLVRHVVAGRGFHWNKRVDQTLCGTLEIHAHEKGLILVNVLPLESYLAGVITAEMSGECPIEFLRAQCITARSWLLALTEAKHDNQPFDRCNDDCCQRYQGTGDLSDAAIHAATSTRGQVLLSNRRKVVDANYSKSCGGIVEIPEHVWGIHKPGLAMQVDAPAGSPAHTFLPVTEANLHEYITGDWSKSADVYCSPQVIPEEDLGEYLGRVDEAGKYFRWTIRYSHDELLSLLQSKMPELVKATCVDNLRVTRRGISGRATEMALDVQENGTSRTIVIPDQYRIRQVLHRSFLFSSAFEVVIDRGSVGELRTLTLHGAGWGHGVGLCQIGALGMSLKGLDHRTIVLHYFTEARLEQVYR